MLALDLAHLEITKIDEFSVTVAHAPAATVQERLEHERWTSRVTVPAFCEDAVDALLGRDRILTVHVESHAVETVTDCVVEDDRFLHADEDTSRLPYARRKR